MQLPVADVDGDDSGGAALEQAVREPARRGADVEAVEPGDVDSEGGERIVELVASPRDEAGAALDVDLRAVVDLLTRLLVTGDEPREHECLRLRTALRQSPLDEQHVQPLLHVLSGHVSVPGTYLVRGRVRERLGGSSLEPVDDVLEHGRVRVDLGEAPLGARGGFVGETARPLRPVRDDVAVPVEDVVDDLEQ